jgi:hypothetical protein
MIPLLSLILFQSFPRAAAAAISAAVYCSIGFACIFKKPVETSSDCYETQPYDYKNDYVFPHICHLVKS